MKTVRLADLEFLEWLDREERHIHSLDEQAIISRALAEGWITTSPGIMNDPVYLRVHLTPKGRDDLQTITRKQIAKDQRL